MRYLRLANGSNVRTPAVAKEARDVCLIDYGHCSESDTCWLFDFASNCDPHDGCIVDTI